MSIFIIAFKPALKLLFKAVRLIAVNANISEDSPCRDKIIFPDWCSNFFKILSIIFNGFFLGIF